MVAAVPALAGIDISDTLIAVNDLGGGNYSYSQDGWFLGGGMVTGTFSGLDLDANMQLNWALGEVSGFTFNYSGSGHVGAFSLGYADLLGLVYDLDGGPLGDGYIGDWAEGIFAPYGSNRLFAAGPGPIDFCGEGVPCAVIANVPEPASWAMMIAGFGLTGAAMRRRRYRAV